MVDYDKQSWANGPEGGTPIIAHRLNHIETGIDEISEEIVAGRLSESEIALAIAQQVNAADFDIPDLKTTFENGLI